MATQERPPQAPPAPPPVVCPRCGTEAEPDQEYCLVCGLRLGPHGHAATRWVFPGQEPAEWVIVVLVALVVAVAGAALAIVFSRSGGHTNAIVATNSQTSVATPSVTIETTTALPTAPTETRPTTTKPKPPPPPSRILSWPAGKNGYTVILNSIPRTAAGRSTALAQARQALGKGLPQVGVLDSSRYSSLHPGYWVVFSGVYSDVGAANAAVPRARNAGYAAYERQIAT